RWQLFLIVQLFLGVGFAQTPEFNADSAHAYLLHLTDAIGPRPMGSHHEREALRWAVEQFHRFGADTAYVLPVPRSPRGINTTSGVAVGLFPGKSDSIIVVGGHIDSTPRQNPGANDNASGTACVLELARIWGQREHRHTLLFAAFGGEEGGLVGSRYFVEHFPHIDRVALMISIDMAGVTDPIVPFFEVKSHQAPRWLVEDAYTIDRALGYNALEYPTNFFSLNTVMDGAGSDHMPFLEKNIPAIDFTTGINTSPIHTHRDRPEFIDKAMLARSGRLVDRMLQKYHEQGVPSPRKGHYMLWEIFGGRLFIPRWLILIFDLVAVVLGILAFRASRARRPEIPPEQRVRFSGLKILGFMVLIAICAQLGEALMQAIKGLRYPWFVPFRQYLWFAGLWALIGLWLSLQLTRGWRFTRDPHAYARWAIILLLGLTVLFACGSARLALYPALSLAIFSLGILLPGSGFNMAAMIFAFLPMFRLMFMEALPLYARTSVRAGFAIDRFLESAAYSAGLTLLLVIWYLPILHIFAHTAVVAAPARQVARWYRSLPTGAVLLLALVGLGGYVLAFPAYNDRWRASVHLEAQYDMNTGESTLTVQGNEYLRKVKLVSEAFRRNYDARILKDDLPAKFTADWIEVQDAGTVVSADGDSLSLRWHLITRRPWYRVDLTLSVDTLRLERITTDLAYRKAEKGFRMIWGAEPPDTIPVAAELNLPPGARLIRKLQARYV
ncbi:MAG: Zn-dependent exopeptidase M28, partial [Calditrichaeota bacterium]